MMKSTKILLRGCALSGAVILLSSGFLIAQVKKVGVTETTVIGDISTLEGVSLTTGIHFYYGNQYWNYEIPLNDPSKTEVSHEMWWAPESVDTPPYGFSSIYTNLFSSIPVSEVQKNEDTSSVFSKFPLEEIIERSNLEPNYKETVLLEDYISEYPLNIVGSIYVGKGMEFSVKSRQLIEEEIEIPVVPQQEYGVTIHESYENGGYYLNFNAENFEVFNFTDMHVEEEQLFFYYQTYSSEVLTYAEQQSGEYFSSLESSAYFYEMDYLINEEEEVDISNLKLVGSLPQGQKVNNTMILGDDLVILVETYPDGKTINIANSNSLLLIYDRNDFSLKQEIPLSGHYTLFTQLEDALFLYSNEYEERTYFTFLKKGENGLYEIFINHRNDVIFPEEIPHILISYEGNVHFKNDKLITAQLLYTDNDYGEHQENLLIRVYDETGILYGGIYEFEQLMRIYDYYTMYFDSKRLNIT